jgi:hypothetical protein
MWQARDAEVKSDRLWQTNHGWVTQIGSRMFEGLGADTPTHPAAETLTAATVVCSKQFHE